MKKIIISFIALSALLGALLSGCTDSAPSGPTPSLGGATVTKYVAIGNSLTAGYQSNGLYESAQMYSFPNLISQQLVKAGAGVDTFQQPYWPDPGNADPAPGPNQGKAQRYVIISFADPKAPVIGQKGETPTATQPKNATTVLRPYDNLGLPGAPLLGFMDTVGTYQGGFGPAIIRSSGGFPKSAYKQILMLNQLGKTPDVVTFWLGANDVLGFATTGGTSPTSPTPAGTFAFLYKQALDTLRKALPNAKIMVATIPDVRAIPFFTTVNASVAPKIPAGAVLYYQKYADVDSGTGRTTLNSASTNYPLITLKGGSYAPLLGQSTGKWYRDVALLKGIPVSALLAALPKIDTTKPFGFHPNNPFPNALILDSLEQVMAINAVYSFNSTIQSIAALDNAGVFDAFTFFNGVKANGYSIAGEKYTADYISGGLFSLDGVHPSSRGYAIVANEFIRIMNSKYGMSVPYVDISKIPGIPMPLGKYAVGAKVAPSIPLDAWKSFDALWNSGF